MNGRSAVDSMLQTLHGCLDARSGCAGTEIMNTSELSVKGHLLLSTLILAMLAGLCLLSPARSHAQPPPPMDRFRWIRNLDDLYPREGGKQLSRPMLTRQSVDIPLPDPSFAVDFMHYPTSAQIALFLDQLGDAYPGLVEVVTAGQSWQDRPIMAVRLGSRAAGDPDRQPALYVDGQHHANEAISAQVVLYFVWYLASQYGYDPLVTQLLDTRTVYAIPCVNPDGNDIFLDSDQGQRRTANPAVSDDDGDGLFDEDGREGAGYGSYDVYHYEFDADWVAAHPDDPFVAGWQSHEVSRRFVGIFDNEGSEVPQVDDDGDGQTGEDPPGGVDANRNYDSHWELGSDNPRTETYHGRAAFSEPETQTVRDFVLARPNIVTACSFHSGADVLLHPWAWSSEAELPDRFWYEMLSRKGSQLTERGGFHGAPHAWTARGVYTASGSTIDWLYEHGILAWTPEVYGASGLSFAERITATNTYSVGLSPGEGFNPSPADIPLTVNRWLDWNLYLLAATPNVGLSRIDVSLGTLNVTVANDGLLPLDVQVSLQVGRVLYTTTVTGLSAAERTWSVPFQPQPLVQTVSITLTGRSRISTANGPPQIEVVRLAIEEETVSIVKGQLEPFVRLGDSFGGWFSGREWDTPEYHLGPPLLFEHFLPNLRQGG